MAIATTVLAVPGSRTDHPGRLPGAVPLAGAALLDAAAAAMLMGVASLPPMLYAAIAAALHGAAVLLLASRPVAEPSRRWLCIAALLAIPGAGVGIAIVLFGTKARGTVVQGRRRGAAPCRAFGVSAALGLRDALSPCEALYCGDAEQRGAAVAALVRRDDPETVVLLRRAAAHPDPDLALIAALALDEISERAERRHALRPAFVPTRRAV